MASSHQVLDNDVLWHAAKDLTSARDSLSIGLASSSIWNVIRTELYRAATTLEQQQALDTRLHHSRMPAIHFSIRNGYNSTTESLMQAAKTHWPGYLDVVWGPGLTPLHLAAATGNTEVVKDLHMEGCVLNAEVYLPTGRTQIFDKGPNLPELSRLYRYQLLHSPYWWEQVDSLNLAIIHKQPDIAQYLLNHMDLQRPSLPNDEPLSPLHVAALVGDAKMVETLLSLNYPLETTRLVDNATRQETALHYAAAHQGDNTTVLSLLLASGASLATTAMSSTTALETAFRNPTSPANARFLLDYSIQTDDLQISDWDSTIRWALDDSHMLPPLQALMNNPVDLLQCRGWDLEAPDVKGRTAFKYAIYHRMYEAAFMLMERNAEWKFRTSAEKLEMARWLRKQPNTGGRPFHWASRLEQSVRDFRQKLREEAAKRPRHQRMTSSAWNTLSW